jgi:WD40 repeat protein
VTGISFSETDREIASSSFDNSIKIAAFPVSEGKPISIDSHELWVYDILYTPDNKHLISCSADKTIRIFSTQNQDMAQKLKNNLKRNLTVAEWKKMVGEDIPYQKTRTDLP